MISARSHSFNHQFHRQGEVVAVAAQIGSTVVGTQGALATVVEVGGDEEREGSYLSCFGQEMEVPS